MSSTRILLVPLFFAAASGWLYMLSKSAPKLQRTANETNALKFPSSFEELHALSGLLQEYYSSHPNFVYVFFCSAYLYKQTFAIPGSVFMNLLGGALFGVIPGFLLACFLSATGATFCYLLSYLCGRHLVKKFFASKVCALECYTEVNGQSMKNEHMRLMPYNLMCVQAGSLLSEIQSTSDILTPAVAAKMALLAIAALLPALLKKVRNNHKGTKTMEASALGDHCEIKDHME
ncbi:transmembrane protein 41A-A-like isoform X4 [Varroa jacobsoni]|uniref:transmembrane protein 41A-A-like isoform X4 n=1 Tax=Varroa jacobsoni TaxID=62625 RepID=UPI000BF8D9F7|nr:transmembrane protein 41A-A-like isoform X4 [Varroa jacobsoni]